MFKYLNNALLHFRVLNDFFFKILSTNLLYFSVLLHLFGLVKMIAFIIQEIVNKLLQIFLNVIEENQFSVFRNVEIVVFLGEWV